MFIPILAINLVAESEADRYLIYRAGYGIDTDKQKKYVLFAEINSGVGRISYDPNQ